jgi:hypothetical protein
MAARLRHSDLPQPARDFGQEKADVPPSLGEDAVAREEGTVRISNEPYVDPK